MSRMAIPTMDVIRFQQDDIIVASAGPFLPSPEVEKRILAGFNKGTQNDATMSDDPIKAFVKALQITHGSLNVFFKYDENDTVRTNDLLGNEKNHALENGVFPSKTTGDNKVLWTWIHQ